MSWFDTQKLTGTIGNLATKVQSMAESLQEDDVIELEKLKFQLASVQKERDLLLQERSKFKENSSVDQRNPSQGSSVDQKSQREQELQQMLNNLKQKAAEKIKQLMARNQELILAQEEYERNSLKYMELERERDALGEEIELIQSESSRLVKLKDTELRELSARVQELTLENLNLTEKLDSLGMGAVAVDSNGQEVNDSELRELMNENSKLSETVGTLKIQDMELKKQIQELLLENMNLVETVDALQSGVNDNLHDEKLEKQMQELLEHNKSLVKELEQLKAIPNAQELVESLQKELSAKDATIIALKEEIATIPVGLDQEEVLQIQENAHRQVELIKGERDEALAAVEKSHVKMEQMQVEIENLENQYQQVLGGNAGLEAALVERDGLIEQLKTEIDALKSQMEQTTDTTNNKETENFERQMMLQEQGRLEETLQDLTKEYQVLQTQYHDIQEQLRISKTKDESLIQELKGQVIELESRNADTSEWELQKAGLLEQIKELESQIVSVMEQEKLKREEMVQDYEMQLKALESVQAQPEVMDEHVHELNETIESLQHEIRQLNQKSTDLLSKDYVETITELQQQVDTLQIQLEQAQHHSAELMAQVQHLTNENSELSKLMQGLSQENQHLDYERHQLNEKMAQIKGAVSAKIKQEMDESERLRGLLSQSTQENESLLVQIQELSTMLASNTTPDDSKQELEYMHSKTAELVSNLQKSEVELQRLREYLVEVEESSTQEILGMQAMLNEFQMQVQTLERERDEWTAVNEQESEQRRKEKERFEESRSELASSLQQLNQVMRKQEQDTQMIQNLQSVLAQFEESKERDIEEALSSLQETVDKLESELEQLKAENQELQVKVKGAGKLQSDTEQLKQELEQKTELVGQLRHDVVQLQSHLSEAMRFMKKGNNEDTVDKKLIANLIIGFVMLPHGDAKRYEILQLISSILKLTDDEKQKMGLIRQAGSPLKTKPTQGELPWPLPQRQAPVGQFQPPRADSLRSPCPGFNTLANHGFLPRNGRGYTKEMVTQVFKEVYNIGEDLSSFLLAEAFNVGLNDTATTLSLGSIGVHSVPQTKIEHDGSMVHVDFALAGNTTTVDPKLVDMMVSYGKNGRSLTFDDLVAFRKDRWTQAIATNPVIDAGGRPQFLAAAETSLVFLNFKNAQNEVPIQAIRSFMGRNQLPRNFVKQSSVISLDTLLATAGDIRAKAAPPAPATPAAN